MECFLIKRNPPNSLLPKTDEIRYIAERTKAAVIGITESKLHESILQSEIQIDI